MKKKSAKGAKRRQKIGIRPPRHKMPWLPHEEDRVRAGIENRWKDPTQTELADALGRSLHSIQQKSHDLRTRDKTAAAQRAQKARAHR